MLPPTQIFVVSESDPVARAVSERWAPKDPIGRLRDGTPIRSLSDRLALLRRPGFHVRDDRLDEGFPDEILEARPTLVFPSIHQSEKGVRCFTVHPIGNLGTSAELGGRPREVVPSAPRLMASALRALDEAGQRIGLRATYEATHHGPSLTLPTMFVEIGYADDERPPIEAVRELSLRLLELEEDPSDRPVLGVGGGHYAPHFTELALERSWAFGHMISRHALAERDPGAVRAAFEGTPGAAGVIYQRAADQAMVPELADLPRHRDGDAPRRARPATERGEVTGGSSGNGPAFGT